MPASMNMDNLSVYWTLQIVIIMIMKKRRSADDSSPSQVNTIRCSGKTLLILITDILDFSRIEANKMVLSHEEFRLQQTVEAAIEIAGLQAAQKRLQAGY